jgi:hypothetical protein
LRLALIFIQTNKIMSKHNQYWIDHFTQFDYSSKLIKSATIIVGTLAGLFIIGHSFRVLAHAVRGVNEFKKSLNGN